MPALDKLHNSVRNALIGDGWTITHDPLTLTTGSRKVHIDLGAERIIAAEQGSRKIAVEVKGLEGPSFVAELEQTIGQFSLYRSLLERIQPERILYLALPQGAYQAILNDALGMIVLEDHINRLLIFNKETEEVTQWVMSTTEPQ